MEIRKVGIDAIDYFHEGDILDALPTKKSLQIRAKVSEAHLDRIFDIANVETEILQSLSPSAQIDTCSRSEADQIETLEAICSTLQRVSFTKSRSDQILIREATSLLQETVGNFRLISQGQNLLVRG